MVASPLCGFATASTSGLNLRRGREKRVTDGKITRLAVEGC
jgi:hypothetical protein